MSSTIVWQLIGSNELIETRIVVLVGIERMCDRWRFLLPVYKCLVVPVEVYGCSYSVRYIDACTREAMNITISTRRMKYSNQLCNFYTHLYNTMSSSARA